MFERKCAVFFRFSAPTSIFKRFLVVPLEFIGVFLIKKQLGSFFARACLLLTYYKTLIKSARAGVCARAYVHESAQVR